MKKQLSTLLALSLCFSLAACGNSGSGDAPATDAPATTAPDAAGDKAPAGDGDTMKIAVLTPLTGSKKENGQRTTLACDFAVEQINADGGVNGKDIELVYFDIGADQQAFITAMQAAVNTDGICATVGYAMSGYTIGASDIVKEAEIPNISHGNSYTVRDVENPYIHQIRMLDDASVKALTKLGYEEFGIKNAAVVWATHSSGQTQHDTYLAAMEELGGKVVADIGYNQDNTSDFGPIMTQVMSSGSDGLVLFATTSSDGILLGQSVKQYEYDKPFCGSSGLFDSYYLSMVGDSVNGMFGIAEFNTGADIPEVKTYLEGMAERDTYGFGTPGWIESTAYDSIFLLAEAAKIAGTNEPKAINDALYEIDMVQGVVSSYTSHEDRSFANYLWTAEVVDEQVVIKDQFYRD